MTRQSMTTQTGPPGKWVFTCGLTCVPELTADTVCHCCWCQWLVHQSAPPSFIDAMTSHSTGHGGPLSMYQGCQIWHSNWVRLATNGTNLGLYKISFSTFWIGKPKCTETDLKNTKIKWTMLSHLWPIWPNLNAKFAIPVCRTIAANQCKIPAPEYIQGCRNM